MILVLDMNNLFWRAFHGLRSQDLRSSRGEPTWAVFGTLNTIAALVRRYEPEHVLLAWDGGRSKYRSEIYPDYKGNRLLKDKEPEVEFQLHLTTMIFSKFNLFQYSEEGVEADDVIAEATYKFGSYSDMLIVSSDHDLRQTITKRVEVLKPSLNVTRAKEEYFKYDEMVEYWGITPDRLPEIWALHGDSTDFIPGARGVGPKTAMALFKKYGSLDAILESGDKKIVDQEDIVRRAYELIKLKSGIARGNFSLDDLLFQPSGEESVSLMETLARYSFDSVSQRVRLNGLWRDLPMTGRKLVEEHE